MPSNTKTIIVSALTALVVVGLFTMFWPAASQKFGAVNTSCQGSTTCFTDLFASGEALASQFTVGFTGSVNSGNVTRTGTTLNRLDAGTCLIKPYATTIAGSTTAQVDCASATLAGLVPLTGVTFGDSVLATLSTTTSGSTSAGGLVITGAAASTTAGYIVLSLDNLTGGTYTWATTGTASGTASYLSVK